MFRLLGTEMEFQENIDRLAVVPPPFVDRFQQMERVHRLDQGDVREHEFELVGLKVADKVPLDVRGHLGHFLRQLLRTVLTEEALPGVVGLHQAGDRVEFGNCHQFHG